MSWQAGALAVLGLTLVAGFAWYERARPDARVVALVATLSAFAALGRIAFAGLPNVKPTTDIVLISGYALGAGPGFVVGSLAGLSSNFFFGQGPWTPWQMAGWGITGLLGAWLARLAPGRKAGQISGRWPMALACGVVGFGFTTLQDVGDWVNYSDHSSGQLAVYVGKGLGFDAVHAGGCVLFALAFAPALGRSLARFATRLEISWRPPAPLAPLLLVVMGIGGLGAPPRAGAATGVSAQVSYLRAAQNRDGGFGPAPGQPSQAVYSGWTALGLAAAGVAPDGVRRGGHSLAAYIQAAPVSRQDPGSVERTILALRAAGVPSTDPRLTRLVARLEHGIRGDGSVSDQVNLTAFAILAVKAVSLTVDGRTVRWLLRQANRDGGFGFGPAGGTSDVDDTGAVLEALAGVRSLKADRVRRRAVWFIRAQQAASGGLPAQSGQDPNAQSTAWAIQGLLAAGGSGRAVERGLGYLRSLIARDGHIRYARGSDDTPVWVTAQALMALEGKWLPLAPVVEPRAAPARKPTAAPVRAAARAPVTAGAGARGLDVPAALAVLAALALAPIGLG